MDLSGGTAGGIDVGVGRRDGDVRGGGGDRRREEKGEGGCGGDGPAVEGGWLGPGGGVESVSAGTGGDVLVGAEGGEALDERQRAVGRGEDEQEKRERAERGADKEHASLNPETGSVLSTGKTFLRLYKTSRIPPQRASPHARRHRSPAPRRPRCRPQDPQDQGGNRGPEEAPGCRLLCSSRSRMALDPSAHLRQCAPSVAEFTANRKRDFAQKVMTGRPQLPGYDDLFLSYEDPVKDSPSGQTLMSCSPVQRDPEINNTCVLTPITTEGPYHHKEGHPIRQNMAEYQDGLMLVCYIIDGMCLTRLRSLILYLFLVAGHWRHRC